MVPALIREDMVVEKVDGQWRTYCSETCHWTDAVAFRGEYEGRPTPNMGRLTGFREWETLHHGKDLADIVSDLGYVRDDGKTLIGQPHWTWIRRRCGRSTTSAATRSTARTCC